MGVPLPCRKEGHLSQQQLARAARTTGRSVPSAPPIEEDIHVEILFHDHIMIVAGPKSRWARPRTIKPSELADEPWVLPRPD
jgi:DNA-binding transcriptional LysR family regulator